MKDEFSLDFNLINEIQIQNNSKMSNDSKDEVIKLLQYKMKKVQT